MPFLYTAIYLFSLFHWHVRACQFLTGTFATAAIMQASVKYCKHYLHPVYYICKLLPASSTIKNWTYHDKYFCWSIYCPRNHSNKWYFFAILCHWCDDMIIKAIRATSSWISLGSWGLWWLGLCRINCPEQFYAFFQLFLFFPPSDYIV